MIRDNFEERLGSVLREAEAAPPEGSWDFIQSKIGKGGFSFPYTGIVITAAAMLTSLAIYDSVRIIPAEKQESKTLLLAQDVDVEEPMQTASFENFELVSTESVEGKNSVNEEPEVEQPKVAVVSEIIREVEEENVTEEVSSTDINRSSENKLPVNVSAARLLQPQESSEITATSAESQTDVVDKTVELKASISGITTCYTPCKLQLKAEGNADHYIWDAGVYGKSESDFVELVVDEPSEFTVFLTGRNNSGKEVVTSEVVKIEKGSTLYVPNSFSPNGDGFNDDFRVKGSEIESFSMSIINSKGRVIFKTTYINEPWIYESSLHDLENEKYIAVVRAVGKDGRVHSFNQPLTIIP